MTRNTPVAVLVVSQVLVIAGALAFQMRIRGDWAALALPGAARERLALAGWVIPACVAIGTLVSLVGLLGRSGRRRLRMLGIGLVVAALPSIGILLAVFAAALGG